MKPPRTHEESEARLVAAVQARAAEAAELVRRKLGDAAAHAARAATQALRDAPEGRATVRKAESSPSFRAALRRLDELLDDLVGPRKDSLTGLLRDARAGFYRDAFAWIAPYLVEGVHRDGLGPSKAGEAVARGAVLHGYDLRSEFAGPIETAKRGLLVWAALAGSRATARKAVDGLLDDWEAKHSRILAVRCRLSLDGSARALLWAVEQALAAPRPS